MAIEVITKDDLQTFRMQLLNDIKQLLTPQEAKLIKPWLKNNDVKKLLGISSNTVQRLRISGKLRSTKAGGVHYYRYEDIEKLLNNDAA
jgi:hypothetical protein